MAPRGSIAKKVPLGKYHEIPFLDRPLQTILSILRYMQTTREEKIDKEIGMYYTPVAKHPFDIKSQKQMEVFGGTFSIESNLDALKKINPIYTTMPNSATTQNYHYVEEQNIYSKAIGPSSFLRNTVPQSPDPTFVDFLNKL